MYIVLHVCICVMYVYIYIYIFMYMYMYVYIYIYIYIHAHNMYICWLHTCGHERRSPRRPPRRPAAGGLKSSCASDDRGPSEGGDDAVGNPRRAQISQFELFEVFVLSEVCNQFSIEQFEPAASQSEASSPPILVIVARPLSHLRFRRPRQRHSNSKRPHN